MSSVSGAPRRLLARVVCVALMGVAAGCGGSGASAWDAKTQELCREKQAAITNLGSVHITYGGIARLGLPAVERLLEGYLSRLLGVLRGFAQRQRELGTPPSVASTMNRVSALDDQVQAATVSVRTAVVHATTTAGLITVFRSWLVTLQHLGVRGEALARQLNLTACESGSSGQAA